MGLPNKQDEIFGNVEPIHKPAKDKILKKLHEVMKAVEFIQKDATNDFSRYNYASERAIKEAVGKAFREHGIVFQVSQSVPTTVPVYASTKADNVGQVVDAILILPIEYTFYDVDSGQSLTGTFNGAGHTRDDKGVYAALTGAIKYILTSNLLIPTGDDPENDHNSQPQQQRTSQKQQNVRRTDKADPNDVLTFGKNKGKRWIDCDLSFLEWAEQNLERYRAHARAAIDAQTSAQ